MQIAAIALLQLETNTQNERRRLVGEHLQEDGLRFNYKVYLASEVNAFAMANGSIRIYSGLMDMLNDDEMLFVLGHEIFGTCCQRAYT